MDPVLERLYRYGEPLKNFIEGLYIVPKYIPESYVSASCTRGSNEINLSMAPGQRVFSNRDGTVTWFPDAGNPEIERDLKRYTGMKLPDAISKAKKELEEAGSERSRVMAERTLRDLYHELAHKVMGYMIPEIDPVREEGCAILLENFWFAYSELGSEKAAIEKAKNYIITELGKLRKAPRKTEEQRRFYRDKFSHLQRAIEAYARLEEGTSPEELIFGGCYH